jgi:hypothetical protein
VITDTYQRQHHRSARHSTGDRGERDRERNGGDGLAVETGFDPRTLTTRDMYFLIHSRRILASREVQRVGEPQAHALARIEA